jgi:ubiquinone/menaquinone biosynthesis C-methylase UbiE
MMQDQSFQRRERIHVTTPELDQAELNWWNRYSPVIDKIWGLSDELCQEARIGYFERIRSILRAHVRKPVVRVLDVACGTGWGSRLLADETVHVTGIDFSDEQIAAARRKLTPDQERFCRFEKRDVRELPALMSGQQYDAISVHCGLHHLTQDEMADFSRALAQAPAGTLIVLVEPMYHDKVNSLGSMIGRMASACLKVFEKLALRGQRDNPELAAQVETMLQETRSRGWFLSPKEMPFSEPEIRAIFDESTFKIHAIRPAVNYALQAGQRLALLEDQDAAARIGRRWLPFFRLVDEALAGSGWLSRVTPDYLFTLIVLERR